MKLNKCGEIEIYRQAGAARKSRASETSLPTGRVFVIFVVFEPPEGLTGTSETMRGTPTAEGGGRSYSPMPNGHIGCLHTGASNQATTVPLSPTWTQ